VKRFVAVGVALLGICSAVPSVFAQQEEPLVAALRSADAEFAAARAEFLAAQSQRVANETLLVAAIRTYDETSVLLGAAGTAAMTAAEDLAIAQNNANTVAMHAYVSSGEAAQTVGALLESPDPLTIAARRLLAGVVGEQRAAVLAEYSTKKSSADEYTSGLADALALAMQRRDRVQEILVQSQAREVLLKKQAEDAAQKVLTLRARVFAESPAYIADKVGIPLIALDAYQKASSWARTTQGCDVEWWGLAGTGRAESNHGMGGGGMYTNGDTIRPVRSIALDGSASDTIHDSDQGALDGDPVWDRAVGPMQFIPTTWRGYAAAYDLDANGDGIENPDNIYDAARATASYLCRNSRNLTSDEGLRRAYFSYNHVDRYVELCLRYAREYQAIGAPDVLVVSDVLGSVTEMEALPDTPMRFNFDAPRSGIPLRGDTSNTTEGVPNR
jgi:membrane-bound lytic murein transglycosylase B